VRRWLIWLCALSVGLAPVALSQGSTQTGQQSTTTTDTAGGGGLPTQAGHSGEYLTTNGTAASWGAVTASVSLTCTAPLVCTPSPITGTGGLSIATAAAGVAGVIPSTGLTAAMVAAANVDGVAGTASLRTLGTGAQQAAVGSHAHAASAVTTTPAGSLAATDAQAAVNELDGEKAPLASPALTGMPTIGGAGITGAAEVLSGSELVLNGTMTGALTSWTVGAAWRYGSNDAEKYQDGTTVLSQAITGTAGQTYRLTFRVHTLTAGSVQLVWGGSRNTPITANGTYTYFYTYWTSTTFQFVPTGTSRFFIDDVSLQAVTTGGGIETTLPATFPYLNLTQTGEGSTAVQMTVSGISGGAQLHIRDGATPSTDTVDTYSRSFVAATSGTFGTTGPTLVGEGYVRLRSTGCVSWSASASDASTGDTFACRSATGVVSLGTTLGGTDAALLTRNIRIPLVADATVQMGQVVMADAGTDGRFDLNATSATTGIGVLSGTGASAAGTVYGIVVSGIGYVTPALNQAVTRGHFLCQSATAGVVDDSASLCTAGLGIGKSLYSEATDVLVSATASTNVIVLTSAPGWAVNDPVVFYEAGGASIAGMTSGNVYWIKTISSADVTLSATKGGAVLDITADGTITAQYLQRLPQAVIAMQ